jgi:hypothetical protein
MRLLAAAVGALLVLRASAVDRSKFRTCKDTGFCSRHRDRETEARVSKMPRHVCSPLARCSIHLQAVARSLQLKYTSELFV